jgi:putative ABC transport system permease protein
MTIVDVVLTAIGALRSNVLRTLLTMLGIIIGIAAVITLTAVGEGAQQGVTDQIRGLGSNLVFVKPGAPNQGGVSGLPGSGASLFFEDAQAIDALQLPYIDSIASQGVVGGPGAFIPAQVIYRGGNVSTTLVGTEPAYEHVRDFYHASGRFINDDDIKKKSLVTVLGVNVAQKLFGTADPVGQTVRISVGPGRFSIGFNFTVVGVMEEKGSSATTNQDDFVFVPLPSLQARISFVRNARGFSNISQINVRMLDTSKVPEATEAIASLLRARHAVQEDDFTIESQKDVLSTATDVSKTLQVLLVSIASIALVVGGIGIMNIMLVSVSERTREIGIRKAVGAKQRDILLQFVVEALMVTTTGGAIGVLVGVGAILVAREFSIGGSDTHYVITPYWVIMGLLVSAATGLIFGVYPAWRAARLDPIEALRRE